MSDCSLIKTISPLSPFRRNVPLFFDKIIKISVCAVLLGIFSCEAAAQTGEQYVHNTLDMLLRVKTLETDIRLETHVDGKEYTAAGRYEEQALQQAPETAAAKKGTQSPRIFFRSQYRLEVNFAMNSQPDAKSDVNRMTLVCHIDPNDKEKSVIEKYTSIEGTKQYSSVNIAKLEERLKSANQEMVFAQISEVRNLGGLAAMIRQISRFYEFSEQVVQENLTGSETIPAVKLAGTLKSVYYKELLQQCGGLDKKGRHPADFPSDVDVWLGRHNNFPYQIRYSNRPLPNSKTKTRLLQETYNHVIINGEMIPDVKFERLKVPDDVFSMQDDTDNFLRSLGL
ncbi:MAG: hypothetical protein LBT46_02325 [Planctomycetaceae bacterium]|jgi:hypothetical protein|nr:hypothetical protein [Planctomycetaceae bacterium]